MPNSLALWALENIDLPEGRIWNFEDRPWLLDIYRAFDPEKMQEIVIPKSSQGGLSTFALSACFYLAIRVGEVNIGYYLPRQDDVSDLVETKVNVMFQEGTRLCRYLSRPDSVRTKKLTPSNPRAKAPSFIRFAEASVPPRILTLDMVVKDEFDLCNATYLAQACSRMDSSSFGITISMGVPYSGAITTLFETESRGKEWFVRCPHCGLQQVMDWEKGNFRLADGEEPRFVCQKCQKELGPQDRIGGEWVAAHPGRSVEGFHVTQFMYPWRTARDLYLDSLRLRKSDFYALKLGQALHEGQSLSEDRAIALLFGAEYFEQETGADGEHDYFLGADQGDNVYISILKKVPDSPQSKIVFLEIVPIEEAQERLLQLLTLFPVKAAGIDMEPNKLLVTNLQKEGFPVWGITQSTRLKGRLRINKEERGIVVQRDEFFDDLYNRYLKNGLWHLYGFSPTSVEVLDPVRRSFIRHLTSLRRMPGSPKSSRKALWVASGADHFAHALSFALVAMSFRSSRAVRFSPLRMGRPPNSEDARETREKDKESKKDESALSQAALLRRRRRSSTRLGTAISRIQRNSAGGSWPAFPAIRDRKETTANRETT